MKKKEYNKRPTTDPLTDLVVRIQKRFKLTDNQTEELERMINKFADQIIHEVQG